MITSSGSVIFFSGSIDTFSSPSITVFPTLQPRSSEITCLVHIATSGSPTITVSQINLRFLKTDTDAKTGTGTGDFAKFLNALDQVVKDYLLVLNPSITFTIV